MLRHDIHEVISPFKFPTLDDLLSRARVRKADLLRKKNKEAKETKRKIKGFTEEEMKALRAMINKEVEKAIKNLMPYYISQTTDNLKEVIKRELEEFKKGGIMNDYRNDMATYCDFMACDVPKF
nr:zinc finger, CCHC-type, retrotransposon Gag domain protein [Tanacetum cinerariifolium]